MLIRQEVLARAKFRAFTLIKYCSSELYVFLELHYISNENKRLYNIDKQKMYNFYSKLIKSMLTHWGSQLLLKNHFQPSYSSTQRNDIQHNNKYFWKEYRI